jgi:outer membrane lipoprotein-sorting protein
MRNALFVLFAVAFAGAVLAQTQPTTDPQIDQVLDELHDRGGTLKEFTADISEADSDTIMGNTTTKTGKVWYQVKPGGDVRLHLLFDKKQVGQRPAHEERREYLLNNGWIIDRDYPGMIETNRQVSQPGEKVNLFELGKGPLPLPIGQDKKDVHEQFDVTLVPPAKDDPPNTVHMQLKPKAGTDLARKFTTLDFWIDRKLAMPIRIETLDAKQSMDQQIDLQNLNVKPGLGDADFTLPAIDDKEWNRHDEPFEQ